MWLVIHCDDRQGILADVAKVISQHGFNIKVGVAGWALRAFDVAKVVSQHDLNTRHQRPGLPLRLLWYRPWLLNSGRNGKFVKLDSTSRE